MKRLLIAGCGDLGVRLARRLKSSEWVCHGLRRRPDQLPKPVQPIGADLLSPVSLAALPIAWDAIIYQATPGKRAPDAYRRTYLEGLRNLLRRVRGQQLIFVSSTAVYGQDDGEWVDESSATNAKTFAGEILLQAEALAQAHGGMAVRFSGIYGPGRDYLIRSLRAGQARCRAHPPQWTNRIHADDCAAVLQHLLQQPATHAVYCASDHHPAPRCEVLNWLAEQLELPAPQPDAEASGQGKRVSNARLTSSGFHFQYPDYQIGYRTLLS